MKPRLQLRGVEVAYGHHTVVKALDLRLDGGVIGCLLGPSGCGKTTLLRAIAGFEPVARGSICLDGVEVSAADLNMPPEHRQVGVVFQDYALFPHLTVAENIAFGLHDMRAPARRARVEELLSLVGLRGSEDRYPHQLSGGQQQRVALARALAPRPRLVLIDEPFSNLDAQMREHLSHELRRILKEAGMTALLVTHDQQDAFVMADEIGVMYRGRLLQWADAETLHSRPVNAFVARFLGAGTVVEAHVVTEKRLLTALGEVGPVMVSPEFREAGRVGLLVRPDQVDLSEDGMSNATIIRRVFRGTDVLYALKLDDGPEIFARGSLQSHYTVGRRVKASLAAPSSWTLVKAEGF